MKNAICISNSVVSQSDRARSRGRFFRTNFLTVIRRTKRYFLRFFWIFYKVFLYIFFMWVMVLSYNGKERFGYEARTVGIWSKFLNLWPLYVTDYVKDNYVYASSIILLAIYIRYKSSGNIHISRQDVIWLFLCIKYILLSKISLIFFFYFIIIVFIFICRRKEFFILINFTIGNYSRIGTRHFKFQRSFYIIGYDKNFLGFYF